MAPGSTRALRGYYSADFATQRGSLAVLVRPRGRWIGLILNIRAYRQSGYTQGEMTSRNLLSRYVRHFVGMTWHNAWS